MTENTTYSVNDLRQLNKAIVQLGFFEKQVLRFALEERALYQRTKWQSGEEMMETIDELVPPDLSKPLIKEFFACFSKLLIIQGDSEEARRKRLHGFPDAVRALAPKIAECRRECDERRRKFWKSDGVDLAQLDAAIAALEYVLQELKNFRQERKESGDKVVHKFLESENLLSKRLIDAGLSGVATKIARCPKPRLGSNYTDFSGCLDARTEILNAHIELLYENPKEYLSPAPAIPPTESLREGYFRKGQFLDALKELIKIVRSAKTSIVLVDGYIDEETLTILGEAAGKDIKILTKTAKFSNILKTQYNAFRKQYGNLEVRASSSFHDRFLIIDGQRYYHFGASIKDLAEKSFMHSQIEEPSMTNKLQQDFDSEWAKSPILVG